MAGVAAAILAVHAITPLQIAPTLVFTAVVVLTAWWGGRGPAIVATLASALAVDYYFLPPIGTILSDVTTVICVLVFLLVVGLICFLQERVQHAAAELRTANDALEHRVQERTAELTQVNAALRAEVHERHLAASALKESEKQLRASVEATEASLRSQELLLRELQHRVKNNLQVINSLLSLQMSRLYDPRDRDLFQDCQQRVRAIARIHDWLFQTPNLASFDFAGYIAELVRNLLHCYAIDSTIVTPRITVESLALAPEHIIPCALIINELVCNALKYAFPNSRPGELQVTLRRRDHRVSLTVADNGVGRMDREQQAGGVGRQIVQALVEQLSGTLSTGNGRGTTTTVYFEEPA